MSIDSRSKLVSFRMTEEEYERFREICYTKGIRNVSEMARAAITLLLQQPDRIAEGCLESRVNELEGRLQKLAGEVKRLQQSQPRTPTASVVDSESYVLS